MSPARRKRSLRWHSRSHTHRNSRSRWHRDTFQAKLKRLRTSAPGTCSKSQSRPSRMRQMEPAIYRWPKQLSCYMNLMASRLKWTPIRESKADWIYQCSSIQKIWTSSVVMWTNSSVTRIEKVKVLTSGKDNWQLWWVQRTAWLENQQEQLPSRTQRPLHSNWIWKIEHQGEGIRSCQTSQLKTRALQVVKDFKIMLQQVPAKWDLHQRNPGLRSCPTSGMSVSWAASMTSRIRRMESEPMGTRSWHTGRPVSNWIRTKWKKNSSARQWIWITLTPLPAAITSITDSKMALGEPVTFTISQDSRVQESTWISSLGASGFRKL